MSKIIKKTQDRQKEITELKQALLRAQEDIEKLSKIKSDFVSIVSHELRTPLTSIRESVSLILDGIAGPLNDDQQRFLKIAKDNIDRLTRTITDIFDFSKLESGRVVMHKKKMDINAVIKDVYCALRGSVEQKHIEFGLSLSSEVEPTWLDPDRISQALGSLISNAVKFNKEKGKITIYSAKENLNGRNFIKVIVEDTGVGIAKEDIPRLFKRFSPLDTSMTRKYRGMGLGLAICKGIIELHGGDVWAESEEARGSRFIFIVPIYKKDSEFNFLLDEAMERVKYNDLKLAIIIFGIKNPEDRTEDNYSKLEKDISLVVRGPDDKVVRYKEGNLIALLAGTDQDGALKIIERVNKKINIGIEFGMAIYPDDTHNKVDLVSKAEEGLKDLRGHAKKLSDPSIY